MTALKLFKGESGEAYINGPELDWIDYEDFATFIGGLITEAQRRGLEVTWAYDSLGDRYRVRWRPRRFA